jgi:hypothetical protein
MSKNLDSNYNFVVLGGGTAGWLTALFIKRYFPETSVTVIQSPDIGILGAGEGTTPHFIDFLDELHIPVSDLVKHAKATIKSGIKFTNWNGRDSSYFHPFKDFNNLFDSSNINFCNYPLLALEQIASGKKLDDISLSAMSSKNNTVRYIKDQEYGGNPILNFHHLGENALHFDANLLAKFLESVGRGRGIHVIENTVVSIGTEEKINFLTLQTGGIIELDFMFDCTGFKRFVIGDHLKSPWKSYKEYLPVNRALPFFIENNTDIIPPYTESIAMKYGWMWKIPVQGRFGCGYVFDSNLISDEEIKKEIEEFLGFEIDIPRFFNFQAGCYKKTWIKNCIAIGLSSSFIEPLEATSIWVSIQQLHSILENIAGIFNNCQTSIERYNSKILQINENILSFVYFHYLTDRKDSNFWKDFEKNNRMPSQVTEFIESYSNDSMPNFNFFANENHVFKLPSWYAVAAGNQRFAAEKTKKMFDAHIQGITKEAYDYIKHKYLLELKETVPLLYNHYDFLEYLKQ